MARSRREKRAFYTLGHIVVGFLICWIPFYLFIMVRITLITLLLIIFLLFNFMMLQRLMRICPIICQNGMNTSNNYYHYKVEFLLFVFLKTTGFLTILSGCLT